MSKNKNNEADFMAKVNVYLSKREELASQQKQQQEDNASLEGILFRERSSLLGGSRERRNSNGNTNYQKKVSFAMDEEENDWLQAQETTQRDLLDKIAALKDSLQKAEEQTTAEREKRKKKEKTLVKLAKELKKRNQQKEFDLERMEELEEKKKYLEHHWVLAGKELDQEKILRKKLQSEQQQEFDRSLREEKSRYTRAIQEYEQEIASLKKNFAEQCEEMSKEVLMANLEADELHSQLNTQKGKPNSPPRRRSPSALTSQGWLYQRNRRRRQAGIPTSAVLLSILVAALFVAGHSVEFFNKGTICAPLVPGRRLGLTLDTPSDRPNPTSAFSSTRSFQAPWWVPVSRAAKESIFEKLCSSNPTDVAPTELEWVVMGGGREAKLTIRQGSKVLMRRAGLIQAEILGDRIRLWNRKGFPEDHFGIWDPIL